MLVYGTQWRLTLDILHVEQGAGLTRKNTGVGATCKGMPEALYPCHLKALYDPNMSFISG